MALHDVRFVEDDWESPTLGAWGLGWECWCDGMEVSQFTYFQQVAGFECAPVSGELTYGLERLAMYVQGVENVYDLNFNGRDGAEQGHLRRRVPAGRAGIFALQFRVRQHRDAVPALQGRRGRMPRRCSQKATTGERHLMALPAYDQCIKASHAFNLLDARGVISVTERQSYILRVRELAKACGAAWLKTAGGGAARVSGATQGAAWRSVRPIAKPLTLPLPASGERSRERFLPPSPVYGRRVRAGTQPRQISVRDRECPTCCSNSSAKKSPPACSGKRRRI